MYLMEQFKIYILREFTTHEELCRLIAELCHIGEKSFNKHKPIPSCFLSAPQLRLLRLSDSHMLCF
jgi:hypothetical protein